MNDDPTPETADKEVADWVQTAIERKISGRMAKADKPALHAAPLDAVPGSPLASRDQQAAVTSDGTADGEIESVKLEANEGVVVKAPALQVERVSSIDFASGVDASSKARAPSAEA